MAAIHGVIVGGDPALANELILNGDFASGANWTQTLSEWVIGSGVATYTAGTGTSIRQVFTGGMGTFNLLRVRYTINSVAGGGVYFRLIRSVGQNLGITRTAPGTYVEDIDAAGYELTQFQFTCTGTSCVIDNVSMKPFL